MALIIIIFSKCGSDPIKYKTAYVSEDSVNCLIVTLKGTGHLHPAGLVDAFFQKTIEDSIFIQIPDSMGIIKCTDVTALDTYYHFTKGNVIISRDSLHINLYSTDPSYPPNDPFYWNGSYQLEWRSQKKHSN